MRNATSSDPWASSNRAWFQLTPDEQAVMILYAQALAEKCEDELMIWEVNAIHQRAPDICITSVPDRLWRAQ